MGAADVCSAPPLEMILPRTSSHAPDLPASRSSVWDKTRCNVFRPKLEPGVPRVRVVGERPEQQRWRGCAGRRPGRRGSHQRRRHEQQTREQHARDDRRHLGRGRLASIG